MNRLLTLARGHAQLVLSEEGLPASIRARVEEIDDVVRQAGRLTRELLAAAS